MTVRLYLDGDSVHGGVGRGLRAVGVDVMTATEAQMLGAADEDQLAFATSLSRTIYTANCAYYQRLHGEWLAEGRQHAGIVCNPHQRLAVGEQLRGLLAIKALFDADDLRNVELYVTNFSAKNL